MSASPLPRIDVFAQGAALARLRAPQAGGVPEASPFQSAGWIEGWMEAHRHEARLHLVEVSVEGGQWLLPLEIAQQAGLRLARKIGGAHASFFTPLRLGMPRALDPADLKAIARALAVDALVLTDCPAVWAGHAPFTPGFPPAPDMARGTALTAGASPLYAGEAGKKLRAKARKLAGLGSLEADFVTGEAAKAALQALLAWKHAQMRALGIADPFGDEAVQRFLLAGVATGTLPLFALRLNGQSVAAMVMARAGAHASGMMTAYTPEAEVARCGPGDVLVMNLLEALRAQGCTGFDLGVGDSRYKRLHAPDAIALVDVHAATSLRGAAFVAVHAAMRALKARIKGHEGIFETLKALRARMAGR